MNNLNFVFTQKFCSNLLVLKKISFIALVFITYSCTKSIDDEKIAHEVSPTFFDADGYKYFPDKQLYHDASVYNCGYKDRFYIGSKAYEADGKTVNYLGPINSSFNEIDQNSFISGSALGGSVGNYVGLNFVLGTSLSNLIPNGLIKFTKKVRTGCTIDSSYAALSCNVDKVNGYGDYAGSVYLFDKIGNEWKFNSKLNGDQNKDYTYFGNSIKILGDYLLVSGPGFSYSKPEGQQEPFNEGAVFLYKRVNSNWKLTKRFERKQKYDMPISRFGMDIDMNSKYIFISDGFKDQILIIDIKTFNTIKILELDGSVVDFGNNIHLDDDFLYVSATDFPNDKVFVFDLKNNFKHVKTLVNEIEFDHHNNSGSYFGDYIMTTEDLIIIPDYYHESSGKDKVFIYYK